jgi:hypothetical protein
MMDRTREESISWARMYLADFPSDGTPGRVSNRMWAADILRLTEPNSDSLDAAWAEAEAALPERYTLSLENIGAHQVRGVYRALAEWGIGDPHWEATADTPAAALRALTAQLREAGR